MNDKTCSQTPAEADREYQRFSELVSARGADTKGPLFHTDAAGLWDAYLDGIPAIHRQHYNCRRCREFIERFGRLVQLDTAGNIETSTIWGVDVPGMFLKSVVQCGNIVAKAKVMGVFLSSSPVWGTPSNIAMPPSKCAGQRWDHLHCQNPSIFRHPLWTAEQMMARKLEDFKMLQHALADYPLAVVEQAVRVLEADALDRGEKTLGVAQWLLKLHHNRSRNLVWLAVATAPPGFCHIRSTMISTLLDDLKQGLPFDQVARRWKDKMHPLQYQRPSAVSDSNLEQANRIVEKLGTQGSLARRFARMEDVTCWIWQPAEVPEKPEDTARPFDKLKAPNRSAEPLELPAKKITWEKLRPLLRDALSIEVMAPTTGPYFGMVTAANPDAPNLLQWDNPVSWYFYHGMSHAAQWNLSPGWVKVKGICPSPAHWINPDRAAHHTELAMIILDGAWDMSYRSGALFFPECLKSEYHEIRKAMEAYSLRSKVADPDKGTANGIAIQKGRDRELTLRVNTAAELATYIIDRWE